MGTARIGSVSTIEESDAGDARALRSDGHGEERLRGLEPLGRSGKRKVWIRLEARFERGGLLRHELVIDQSKIRRRGVLDQLVAALLARIAIVREPWTVADELLG